MQALAITRVGCSMVHLVPPLQIVHDQQLYNSQPHSLHLRSRLKPQKHEKINRKSMESLKCGLAALWKRVGSKLEKIGKKLVVDGKTEEGWGRVGKKLQKWVLTRSCCQVGRLAFAIKETYSAEQAENTASWTGERIFLSNLKAPSPAQHENILLFESKAVPTARHKQMTPARDLTLKFLCKPVRRIMEEKSMTRSHGGLNHWKRNHRGGIIEEAGIWKASGRHLGGIWEAPGEPRDSRRPGGSRRLPAPKIDARLSYNAKVLSKC
jgi:hypothetical protein